MKLEPILKTSLDELRMQMLGSQVLFGFQFQGLFQDNFDSLPSAGRNADAAALVLMTIVLGLIVAVPCQHRIVEKGTSTLRILRVSSSFANYSLAPIAAAIAFDMYVATVHVFGNTRSVTLAIMTFALAIGAWYLVGKAMQPLRNDHRGTSSMQESPAPLHAKIELLLTEARVILPGAQALLGFQLIVMMTKAFDQLAPAAQTIHLIGLTSLVLAIVLLISPAAIHRVGFQGLDDRRFLRTASLIITAALVPLAASISCEMWVALFKLYGNERLPTLAAFSTAALLSGLWFLWPLAIRAVRSPR
jgi:fumarate reductase subunit D